MTDKNVHAGHRNRVKRRYILGGLDTFEDHQMLELLLFYSISQGDTNVIAHELLDRFGSIDKVFDAPIEELCKVKGVGHQTASLIKLVPRFSKCDFAGEANRVSLINGKKVESFCSQIVGSMDKNSVYCAFLDDCMQMIYISKISNDFNSDCTDMFRALVSELIRSNSKRCMIFLKQDNIFGSCEKEYAFAKKTLEFLKMIDTRLEELVLLDGKHIRFLVAEIGR